MKITIPELVIDKTEGFTINDIFERKAFGDRLANLIENTDDNLVLALDSQWGEGKTTFIKMWRGHVENHRDNKLITIYFDAFSNDYQKDPFLALISEIYEILPDNKQNDFKTGAIKAAKAFALGSLKTGIGLATGGLVDGTKVENFKDDITKAMTSQIENIIDTKLKTSKENKSSLEEFNTFLKKLPDEINQGKPIVFIIDELDRCRPDFALELIEQIKHLFSVPKITFLLVTNRVQLEKTIELKYGQGIQSSLYLQKFVHLWLSLPKKNSLDYSSNNDNFKYFQILIERLKINKDKNFTAIEALEHLVKYKERSFRDIERLLSCYSILHNTQSYKDEYQDVLAIVSYLHVFHHKIIKEIYINNYDINKILEIFEFESPYKEVFKKCIILHLGSEEEISNLLDKPVNNNRHRVNYIKKIIDTLIDLKS